MCPGQVDVEEKEEGTETEDGGLGGGISTIFGELEKGMYV